MPDSYLRYAPRDPQFVPAASARRAAENLLRDMLPRAQAVRSVEERDVMFVDCGGNWSGVRCSACGRDAGRWWADAMSEAYRSRFASLSAVAPCCSSAIRLNELDYIWPVAFARYFLEAANPDSCGLSEAQMARLSEALGTDLIEVPCHL